MEKRRIGNDLGFVIHVVRKDNIEIPLEQAKDIRLDIICERNKMVFTPDIDVIGDTISFWFPAKEQRYKGDYSFIITYEFHDSDQPNLQRFCCDKPQAFELVGSTTEETSGSSDIISVQLSTSIVNAIKGKDGKIQKLRVNGELVEADEEGIADIPNIGGEGLSEEQKLFLGTPADLAPDFSSESLPGALNEVMSEANGKAPKDHDHDGSYAPKTHNHDYAPSNHNHDSSYAGKMHTHDYAPVAHNHDSSYAPKTHGHDDKLDKPEVGGTAGQVLTKTAVGHEWKTPSAGDGSGTPGSVDIITDLDTEGLTNDQVPGALATKLKFDHLGRELGQMEKIIFKSVYTGNPEYQVTAINLETGAFTFESHTFDVGDKIFFRHKNLGTSSICLPVEFGNATYTEGHQLKVNSISGNEVIFEYKGAPITFTDQKNVGVSFKYENLIVEKIINSISRITYDATGYTDIDVIINAPVFNFQNRYNITGGEIEQLRRGNYVNGSYREYTFEGINSLIGSNAFYRLQTHKCSVVIKYHFANQESNVGFMEVDYLRTALNNASCYISGYRTDKIVACQERIFGNIELANRTLSFDFTPINGAFVIIKGKTVL